MNPTAAKCGVATFAAVFLAFASYIQAAPVINLLEARTAPQILADDAPNFLFGLSRNQVTSNQALDAPNLPDAGQLNNLAHDDQSLTPSVEGNSAAPLLSAPLLPDSQTREAAQPTFMQMLTADSPPPSPLSIPRSSPLPNNVLTNADIESSTFKLPFSRHFASSSTSPALPSLHEVPDPPHSLASSSQQLMDASTVTAEKQVVKPGRRGKFPNQELRLVEAHRTSAREHARKKRAAERNASIRSDDASGSSSKAKVVRRGRPVKYPTAELKQEAKRKQAREAQRQRRAEAALASGSKAGRTWTRRLRVPEDTSNYRKVPADEIRRAMLEGKQAWRVKNDVHVKEYRKERRWKMEVMAQNPSKADEGELAWAVRKARSTFTRPRRAQSSLPHANK